MSREIEDRLRRFFSKDAHGTVAEPQTLARPSENETDIREEPFVEHTLQSFEDSSVLAPGFPVGFGSRAGVQGD